MLAITRQGKGGEMRAGAFICSRCGVEKKEEETITGWAWLDHWSNDTLDTHCLCPQCASEIKKFLQEKKKEVI